MKPRWRIDVDAARCQGTGQCAGIAPRHFALAPGSHSRPLEPTVDPDPAVLDAADCCPAEAIAITDAETGTRIDRT
jgi:ferredoxin